MHQPLDAAVADAERYHRGQLRKGTHVPYVSHLLAVCSLVLEAGGSDVEATAALLHDAVEDVQIPNMSGTEVLAEIGARHGDAVAHIVKACSDDFAVPGQPKKPWRERKDRYIARLSDPDESGSVLLVSAADKLHNLRSIYAEWQQVGDAVWDRFSAPRPRRDSSLWYYRSLYNVYAARAQRDERLLTLIQPMGRLLRELETAPH